MLRQWWVLSCVCSVLASCSNDPSTIGPNESPPDGGVDAASDSGGELEAGTDAAAEGGVPDGGGAGEGIWISADEIAALPANGAVWDFMRSHADGTFDTSGDRGWSDPTHFDTDTLAAAFVAARLGLEGDGASLRTKAADAIMDWMNGYATAVVDYQDVDRNTASMVIAADVIEFSSLRPADEEQFRRFIADLRFHCHQGKSPFEQMADRPNNHGTIAMGAHVAVSADLLRHGMASGSCGAGVPDSGCLADGDGQFSAAEHQNVCDDPALAVQTAADIFHAWVGDRTRYQGLDFSTADLGGGDDWQCNVNESYGSGNDNGYGINPVGCSRDGHDIGGVLPDDQRRGGPFTWPPFKENYNYTALQGVMVSAVLLDRQGHDVWNWEDQALRRAWDWLHDAADFPATDPVAASDDGWQPYIPNYFYGTSYPTDPDSIGKNMAWTAWAFGER